MSFFVTGALVLVERRYVRDRQDACKGASGHLQLKVALERDPSCHGEWPVRLLTLPACLQHPTLPACLQHANTHRRLLELPGRSQTTSLLGCPPLLPDQGISLFNVRCTVECPGECYSPLARLCATEPKGHDTEFPFFGTDKLI